MTDDAARMREAIAKTREGIDAGQTPFGACIVKGDDSVALAHNTVWRDTDITAHAEMNAIRDACAKLGTIDLSGCTIYTTCEPCPMCFSAIHWARISKVVYGARISDARKHGFNELPIHSQTMARMGESPVQVVGDFMREECRVLFGEWEHHPSRKPY